MASSKMTVKFNQSYFDSIMRAAGVQALELAAANRVLAQAQATAPVKTGAYEAGLHIERAERKYRTAFLVVGSDKKTLLVEAKTGNLARALKSVGR